MRELSGSKTMLPGYTLLARVADLPGVSLLAGTHPQTLPRSIAMTIIGHVRREFRLPRRVTAGHLKSNDDIALSLAVMWEDTAAAGRSSWTPDLQ